MPHLPLQIGLHYLWWLLGYQSRTQFISPHPCSYYTIAFDSWWEIGGKHSLHHEEKKKNTHACVLRKDPQTHTCTFKLLERSKRLITGMRLWEEKWGGAKVDLSAAWSHPVVTMGHPLLRWQWEWQAYLRGRRRAVTDWTDRAVGGCVEMTCCISIWVKNLANVAGWVRRAQRVRCFLVGWSVDFSASLFGLSVSLWPFPRLLICVCDLPVRLFLCLLQRHESMAKNYFPHLISNNSKIL